MKEHPIIFSTPMVKAILSGQKTQTRRIIKPQPNNGFDEFCLSTHSVWRDKHCPYGQVGDRLWVRETHYKYGFWERFLGKWHFRAISAEARYFDNPPDKLLTGFHSTIGWYKRPSIFMFRFDSRITLEITEVRVEGVQEIKSHDATAEGIRYAEGSYEREWFTPNARCLKRIDDFRILWDSLNAKRGYGWDTDPWVWVISFKREAV